jgi:hypothetical protein
MTAIILIEHNGNIKNVKTKELTRDTLYKKCGLRSNENFERTTTWEVEHNKEMFIIELWAKTEGKANHENKYDFPPPVDNSLYYGTCALIRVDEKDRIINLSADVWLKLYEKLFGGFEELDDDGGEEDEEDVGDEEEEEEEEVEIVNKPKKKGKKEEEDEDEEEDGEEEEGEGEGEEEEVRKKPSKKTAVVIESEEEEIDDYYGSELEEEAYSYSDED